ncbi:MAG: hypothetical protein Q9221_009154, partial [Calogaya cf. arnoldii]
MLFNRSTLVSLFYLANVTWGTPVVTPRAPLDLASISNGVLSNDFVSNETRNNELAIRNPNPAPLVPRRSIDEKCAIINSVATSVVAIAAIPPIVTGLRDLIKYLSDIGSCEVQTGSIAGTNVNFEYKASGGEDCDTTSEKKTIEAALTTCVEKMQQAHAEKMC